MLEQIREGMESMARPYNMGNDDIIVVLMVMLFLLFTFVVYRSRTILLYKLNTYFSSRQIYSSDEVSTSNQEFVDIVLLILIGCFSLGLNLYQSNLGINCSEPHYGTLLLFVLYIVLMVVFKGMMYGFINWTFFTEEKNKTWLSAFFFSIAITSILLFPLALMQVFVRAEWINMQLCLLGILILQKILLLCKLYVNFRPKRYGGLLFFLYFCSVEIMPTLIVWHILQKMNIESVA
ncbi:MAG: DUF4271 domain-containing protein [Bacteroidaceae bacterium]|nr:DUF4271 domain-containing protein [Bacteroidaceae bacterium]